MNISEVWASIYGFEKYYQISSLGRVKAMRRYKERGTQRFWTKEKLLNPKPDGRGYKRVLLYGDISETPIRISIHRLVAEAFIPNPENKPQINHINGIKTDNGINNLEWCTSQENLYHAYASGLNIRARGERVGISRLKEKQVVKIRKIYQSGKYTQLEVANMFGVSRSAIRGVINGETWKHV